jgi:ribosomal protein L31E
MGGAVVRVSEGPNGLGHALGAVRKIATLATQDAHTYEIRSLATRITRDVPSKDKIGELGALYRWVRDNVRYRHDPRGLEWIQAPTRTLKERAGDCDDLAGLLSALAQSIGYETRYRTVGPKLHDQRHVSTEALANESERVWVSLDPVLEPPRKSTKPSSDLGQFGQRAPGAAVYYSETGHPMTTLRGTASGALWDTTPLEQGESFAPLGPSAYRSAGAPGGGRGGAMVPMWRNPYDPSDLAGLGAEPKIRDFNSGNLSTDAARAAWSTLSAAQRAQHGNNIQRWWGAIGPDARVSTRASFAAMRAEVPTFTTKDAAVWWGRLGKGARQARRKRHSPGYDDGGVLDVVANVVKSVAPIIPVYGNVIAAGINAAQGQGAFKDPVKAAAFIVGGPAGGQIAPFVSSRGVNLSTGALKQAVNYNMAIMNAAAPGAPAGTIARVPGAAQLRPMVATAKAGAPNALQLASQLAQRRETVLRTAPRVALSARQFDALRSQLWARPGLSGLSLNWALSGLGYASSADSAAAAVTAVAAFIKRQGKPPQIAIPAVLAMQKEIPGLKADGLWGNNSRKAAAWALSKAESAMPAVTPGWARNPATWQPPTAATAAAVPPPAPAPAPVPTVQASAPVAPRPATTPAAAPAPRPPAVTSAPVAVASPRRKLAQQAVAAVRSFIAKNGKPPMVAISAVRAYQVATAPVLATDGLWGNATRALAAQDMGVAVSTLPPVGFKAKAPAPAPAASHGPGTVRPGTPAPPAPAAPVVVLRPSSPTPQSAPAATRKQLAQKAVNAVRSFIASKGKPPQISIAAVRAYQVAAPPLNADGLWGDATRSSAAADLGVKVATLPPVAPAFKAKPQAVQPVPSGPSSPIVLPPPSPGEPPVVLHPVPSSPGLPPPPPMMPAPIYEPPPAPPEPVAVPSTSSSGQGALIALAILALSRRKRRAH